MKKTKNAKEDIIIDLDTNEIEVKNSFLTIFIKHKLALAIIFLSCIVLYSNTISHDYALDDQLAIYDNSFVKKGFDGIYDLLTNDAFVGFFGERGSKLISGGRYRPLSFITFAIEWQFFERAPMVSHIVNIILYGLLCMSIYLFLVWFFKPNKDLDSKYRFIWSLPFVATMLYAFHPIHTEVVANIKGRDEILSMLFSMLSLIYFFQFKIKTAPAYLNLFILFFLALMSKENAITFLAIFPIVDLIKNGKSGLKANLTSYLFILNAVIVFLLLRSYFTSSGLAAVTQEILNNPFVRANSSEKWGTIFYSFYRYFALLIFPHPLTHDYYFNQIPYRKLSDPIVLASFVGILGLIFATIKSWKNHKNISFSILFFVMTFSIVSNIFFTVGIIMNERFVFVSSLGFCIILASLLLRFRDKFKPIIHGVLILILLCYSIKTISRNFDWKNNTTLFTADYTTSNQSAKVSTALGGVLMERANEVQKKDSNLYKMYVDSSIRVLEHAMRIYPENSQSILLYGNSMYAKNKNIDEAINIYREAIKYRPGGYFDALYNVGVLFYNQGKMDSALKYTELAYKAKPDHIETKDMLAKLYAKFGRSSDAIQLSGGNASSLSELAINAKDGGNYQEAISLANQALAANPNDAKANYVIGICYARFMNRIPEGIPYLEKAIEGDKNNGYWMEDLAVAYGMSGQIKKTIPILERVIELRPNEPAAYRNLATSYMNLGQGDKAAYYTRLADEKAGVKK